MLRDALKATARRTPDQGWTDSQAMRRHLAANAALGSLFENVVAARPNGDLLGRLAMGELSDELPNIADRSYFQMALLTDQTVISDPLAAKTTQAPVVVMAVSARNPRGETIGVLAGVLTLSSNSLFSETARTGHEEGLRVLIMNRQGVLMAHTDRARLLGRASDEPGLKEAFVKWHASGSPIETLGGATVSEGHLVATAGVPDTDWTLVRLTPMTEVLAPIASTRRLVWPYVAAIAAVTAALSGVLAWRIVLPISKLRSRARTLLTETNLPVEDWPRGRGEVGQLGRAFARVVEQRRQKQSETDSLLAKIEVVLEHAEVGIALTRDGRFEMVSRAFCELFGFAQGYIVGQRTSVIHPSQDAYDTLSAQARPAFLRDGAFSGDFELVRATGSKFWARMRGRAVSPGDRSKGTIWTVEDITASRQEQDRLAWTSSHDHLTRLANRATFEHLLEEATAQAALAPFCAMFIDLDRFKLVNDTGGHLAGDALLRDVAQALVRQVRQDDTVARLGGDEFAILLRGCPLHRALAVGEKLRIAVQAYRLNWEGKTFGVGASIGVVAVDGTFADAVAVLSAADTACYEAKAKGRNAVAVFQRT